MPDTFEAMVDAVADRLRDDCMTSIAPEHPAVVYTEEGYQVWLDAAAKAVLVEARVPELLAERDRLREALKEAHDPPFRPFGKLDPNDPIDQAIVRGWNRGAAEATLRAAAEQVGRGPLNDAPRCTICGHDEHVAQHLPRSTAKWYHPFVAENPDGR